LGIILLGGIGILSKINLWPLGAGMFLIKILGQLRYSVVEGERMMGFLVDRLRFVGMTDKLRLVNEDLSNLVSQTMLKIEIRDFYYLLWVVIWLVVGLIYGKYFKNKQSKKTN
jgi:hypothetical protein